MILKFLKEYFFHLQNLEILPNFHQSKSSPPKEPLKNNPSPQSQTSPFPRRIIQYTRNIKGANSSIVSQEVNKSVLWRRDGRVFDAGAEPAERSMRQNRRHLPYRSRSGKDEGVLKAWQPGVHVCSRGPAAPSPNMKLYRANSVGVTAVESVSRRT